MRNAECRKYWDAMVDLSEGKDLPEASHHAQNCRGCGERLAELRRIIELAGIGAWDPPDTSRSAVLSLFKPSKPVVLGKFRAAGAGARSSVAEHRQVHVEAEGMTGRLLIRSEGNDLRIMGRIEAVPQPTLVVSGEQSAVPSDGTFELGIKSLEDVLWIEFADRTVRLSLVAED